MKLTMQYTTPEEKKLIREASKIESDMEAEQKGWIFIGSGVYKKCFRKGNVVLKFGKPVRYGDTPNHMEKELEFYKKTPKHLKKYLARVFGGNASIMIQRFVDGKLASNTLTDFTDKEKALMSRISSKIRIWDWCYGQNLTIDKDGNVKAYDFAGQM